jgi:hypothetical protein
MLADRLLLRHPEVPNLQIPALINATQRRLSASRSWQLSAYALSIFLGRKCESCRSMKIYIYIWIVMVLFWIVMGCCFRVAEFCFLLFAKQ